MLTHPTAPSGMLLFEFLRTYQNSTVKAPFTQYMFGATERARVATLWFAIVKCAQVLHKEGRGKEAHWVLDFTREQRPDVFGEAATFGSRPAKITSASDLEDQIAGTELIRVTGPAEPSLPLHQKMYRARKALSAGAWSLRGRRPSS